MTVVEARAAETVAVALPRRRRGVNRRLLMEVSAFAATIAALIALQPTFDVLGLDRAVTLLTMVAAASAWNLVAGYGGLFSIGHAMFVGAGAYTTSMLMLKASLPLIVVLACSALVAGGIGLAVALPLMRLRAAYFSVASLGIALAGQAWMTNWDWTGASTGLQLPISRYVPPERLYWLALGLAGLSVGAVLAIVRSGWGLRLMALRDDEEAAAEIGIRRSPVVLATWTVSAALVGLCGATIALQKGTIEPNSAFAFGHTLDMILSTVLGGVATVMGPVLGATLLFVVRLNLDDWRDWASVVLGLGIIAVVRFAPGGLWGLLCLAARRLARGMPPRRRLRRLPHPRLAGSRRSGLDTTERNA